MIWLARAQERLVVVNAPGKVSQLRRHAAGEQTEQLNRRCAIWPMCASRRR
jgi:hypothetical protein